MNKKIVTMATSLAVGGSLLIATSFANASQMSGYDSYKSAVKDTKNLKNETADIKVAVTDNGSNLVNLSSTVKLNLKSNAMSSIITVTKGTTSQIFNNYMQDGKSINKNSDSAEYLVKTNNAKDFNKIDKAQNPTVEKSMEVVLDTLVGTMKDNVVTTSNTDGTKNLAINLSETEVTPLVDAVTQMALIRATKTETENDNKKNEICGLKNVLPQLESEIKIKSVSSTGKISKEDIVTNQTAKIVVEGKDIKGVKHEITFNIDLNLSKINTTTPDKVDLKGKQVKEMTSSMNRHFEK